MSQQDKKDITISAIEDNFDNTEKPLVKDIIEKYKKLDIESESVLNKITARRKRKQNGREKIPA